ncbi:MAG: hypothetical protein P1P88_15155, partial [Bacteroidales bacterium]|nr:hypothetical protein [Bacteroidales bacterium]
FTRFIYPIFFKSVSDSSGKKESKKKSNKIPTTKSYNNFNGKIIRHIYIITLDPFGYSIADSMALPKNFFSKTANNLHIKTREITIRNLLLIKQNQVFDPMLVAESERLVRRQSYVRDVSFFIISLQHQPDSIDILIRELDHWSIIPEIGASTSQVTIKLGDQNFLGLGHESQNSLTRFHSKGDYAYNANYYIPNIKNTYINSTLHYGQDELRNFIKRFAIDRPFFSPVTKWAAGISFVQQFRKDSVLSEDLVYLPQNIKFNAQDYWAGWAVQIFKGKTSGSRTTNFISAFRFFNMHFLEEPIELIDPEQNYADENLYLASFGISTRKYVQDKYIFKYGIIEDVPIGKVYNITSGYQKRNNTGRLYLGARFSLGNYYPWGYLNSNFEYGTFFHKSKVEQSVLTASLTYFTRLKEIGNWKIRQFVKPQLTIGIKSTTYDSLTINDGFGLDGFNSPILSGTKRLLLTLQSQIYAPWKVIGFRFSPYVVCSFGALGNASEGFKNSKVYTQLGLGVMVKNENLVLNTFQISLSFYPIIPGNGTNVFKFNSVKSTDFGFNDFETGKPATVVFQ